MKNVFVEEYDPTIEESFRRQVAVDNDTCFLNILDTAGQEEYKILQDQHIRGGDAFILVCAINSKATLDELKSIHERIVRVKDADPCPVVVAANKCDLPDRSVQPKDIQEVAAQFGCKAFETSAKTRQNVDELFFEAVRVARRFADGTHESDIQTMTEDKSGGKGCCTVL